MNDLKLKLAMARLLPERIEVLSEDSTENGLQITECVRWKSPSDDLALGSPVLETEWLYVMHLVEQEFLKNSTFEQICFWLDSLYHSNGLNPYVWRNAYGSGKNDPTPPVEMAKICASGFNQRATAMCKVKGVTP